MKIDHETVGRFPYSCFHVPSGSVCRKVSDLMPLYALLDMLADWNAKVEGWRFEWLGNVEAPR